MFNLPQAGEEVSFSTEIWEGKSFLDKLATEANFRKFADNTDIIHLSSHSIINNDNPMFSKIVFSNDSNTSHDGLLHTYELYNMQLSARLVCLSACNTENGKR